MWKWGPWVNQKCSLKTQLSTQLMDKPVNQFFVNLGGYDVPRHILSHESLPVCKDLSLKWLRIGHMLSCRRWQSDHHNRDQPWHLWKGGVPSHGAGLPLNISCGKWSLSQLYSWVISWQLRWSYRTCSGMRWSFQLHWIRGQQSWSFSVLTYWCCLILEHGILGWLMKLWNNTTEGNPWNKNVRAVFLLLRGPSSRSRSL